MKGRFTLFKHDSPLPIVDKRAFVTLRGVLGLEVVCEGWNHIVDDGLVSLRRLLAGGQVHPRAIAFGTGSTAPADGDQALEAEVERKDITRRIVIGTGTEFYALLQDSDAVGVTLTEIGLFDSTTPNNGTMWSRALIDPFPKDGATFLTAVWELRPERV